MSWNNLELSDKAKMIRLAVKSGITDLNTIHEVYNKFENGGNITTNREFKRGGGLNIYQVDLREQDHTPLKKSPMIFKSQENNYGNNYMDIPYMSVNSKRDYIGGTPQQTRLKALQKGNMKELIGNIADQYGVDKDLLTNRFMHEGFLDMLIDQYNKADRFTQPYIFSKEHLDKSVDAFNSLGLDWSGSRISDGTLKLKDPSINYNTIEERLKVETPSYEDIPQNEWEKIVYCEKPTNEIDETVDPAEIYNLKDGLNIMAAELVNAQNYAKKRATSPKGINTYTNAIYNLGPYHKDLNDSEWVNSHYKVPSVYNKFNNGGVLISSPIGIKKRK